MYDGGESRPRGARFLQLTYVIKVYAEVEVEATASFFLFALTLGVWSVSGAFCTPKIDSGRPCHTECHVEKRA